MILRCLVVLICVLPSLAIASLDSSQSDSRANELKQLCATFDTEEWRTIKDADTLYVLGLVSYSQALGCKNDNRAKHLLRRSALKSHADAQFQLCRILYQEGDEVMYIAWCFLASKNGNKEAKLFLDGAMARDYENYLKGIDKAKEIEATILEGE